MKHQNHPVTQKLTTILGCAFLCISLLSCQNFMNAGKVSEEIKEAIAYNNAKSVNVSIECPEDMGTIFPKQTYQAKVGYDFEVQFIPNKENYVIKDLSTILQAVSRIDQSVSRNDYVTFTVAEQSPEDIKSNLYRIKVKITQYSDDILIKPDCHERPRVESYKPVTTNGTAYVTTPIIIKFNIPINPETIKGNILIKYINTDVSDLFMSPVYDRENYTITITPKKNQIISFITSKAISFAEFTVSLTENITATNNGITLPLKLNDNSSFLVRYSATVDETPPDRVEFLATRYPITLTTAKSLNQEQYYNISTDIDNMTYEKFMKNFSNNYVYIYGKFLSRNNEIESITIKPSNYGTTYDETVFQFSEIESSRDEEGNTSFCLKYDLSTISQFKTYYNLECYVTNSMNINSDSIAFTVSRKRINLEDLLVYNFPPEFMTDTEKPFNNTDFNSQLKCVKISYNPKYQEFGAYYDYAADYLIDEAKDDDDPEKYTAYTNYFDDFVFEYKYYDDSGILKTGICDNNKDEMYFYFDLQNVASVNGLQIIIQVTDNFQNQAQRTVSFPNINILNSITKNGNKSELKFIACSESENSTMDVGNIVIWNSSQSTTPDKYIWHNIDDTIELISGTTYYIIPCYYSYELDHTLCGDISSTPYTTSTTMPQPIENVQLVGEPELSKGRTYFAGLSVGNRTYVNIQVNIAEDSWSKFDTIFLTHGDENYYFQKNQYSIVFEKEAYLMYQANTKFTVYGTKGNSKSSGTEKTITKFTGTQYDYNTPYIIIEQINPDYFTVKLTDGESGPKYGYVKDIMNGNNYRYTLTSTNNFTVKIPVWELLEEGRELQANYGTSLEVIGFDNNDNQEKIFGPVLYPLNSSVVNNRKWNYRLNNTTSSSITIDARDSDLDIYTWNPNGTWVYKKSITGTQMSELGDSEWIYRATWDSSTSFIGNSIIRVVPSSLNGRTPIGYFFTGGSKNSGDFDLITPNGNSKTSIGISSDAPVYVHTVVTTRPYSECINWSVEEWDTYRKYIGGKKLTFTSSDHSSKRYNIPVDQINSGECYCVIAHFADGTRTMSEVMQK